jgi:predicted Rossmann-fold nucleotide-binding protein
MWVVGASLNDRTHAYTDVSRDLEELFERVVKLRVLLEANHGNTVTSRVALYYAFLLKPELRTAEKILVAIHAGSEELRYARALLPWLRSVSWIARRIDDDELIDLANRQIDMIQSNWPSTMTSKGEFSNACQYEIHQHIRPWLALARFARDAGNTVSQPGDDPSPSPALFEIVEKMRKVSGDFEVRGYDFLLREPSVGRRLIAYSRLVLVADENAMPLLIEALEREREKVGQYLALAAIEAQVRLGVRPGLQQRGRLLALEPRFPYDSDRAAVLSRILDADPTADDESPVAAESSGQTAAPTLWVLVVGTGRQQISQEEVFASEILGPQLARSGLGLISGGWQGVDHVVAREFSKQRRQQGDGVEGALTHVLAPEQIPDFAEGTRKYVEKRGQEGKAAVEACDAVILIGGLGGTYDAYRWANQRRKPVYPLAGTGGDAKRAFDDMVKRGLLTPEDALGSAITSHDEAQRVVESLLSRLLKAPFQPNTSTSAVRSVDVLGETDPVIDQLREKAREYLRPQPLHDSERVAMGLRTMCNRLGRKTDSGILRKLLNSAAVHDRVVGYFMFQAGPTVQAVESLFKALEIERLYAAQTRETRPLWQLLVCLTQVMKDGRFSENIGSRDAEALRRLSEFLRVDLSIDPGGEFKTRLETVQRLAEVLTLAQEYKLIRRTQTAGPLRTHNMTELVQRMRPVVRELPSEYLLPMLVDVDRGRRLSGYVYLYEVPIAEKVSELVDSLTRIENTPFGQYWALMALSRVLPKVPSSEVPDETVRRLRAMRDNLKPGIDRHVLLTNIMARSVDQPSRGGGST